MRKSEKKMNNGSGCIVRRKRKERVSRVCAENIRWVIIITDLIFKSVTFF